MREFECATARNDEAPRHRRPLKERRCQGKIIP
jgi:hypothetical protein